MDTIKLGAIWPIHRPLLTIFDLKDFAKDRYKQGVPLKRVFISPAPPGGCVVKGIDIICLSERGMDVEVSEWDTGEIWSGC